MKKLAALGLVLVLVFSMTGCGNDISLNKQENDLVAEYIAGVMLKYSYVNEWEYQKLKISQSQYKSHSSTSQNDQNVQQPTNPVTGTQTPTAGNQTGNQNTGGNTADTMTAMASALGLAGVQISYQQYVVDNRYPTGDVIGYVPANAGCQIVAVEFTLKNNTGSEVIANTKSSGVILKMNVNEKTITQSATLLKNDLTELDEVKIGAGAAYTAVTIFQVPEAIAADLSNMTLSVYANGTSIGQVPGL